MENSKETWLIEWTYSPNDFFEEELAFSTKQYRLSACEGKVRALLRQDPRPDLCKQLDAELRARFKGVQLVSQKPYDLSRPYVTHCKPDGSRSIFVNVESLVVAVASITADIRITNKDGEVIADSRVERIKRKRSLGDLAAQYATNDTTAKEILESFHKAIVEPENCLRHLYDIRDALDQKFGNGKETRMALNLSRAQWDNLGRLANKEPLRQGRHPGKRLEELRDATPDELHTAKKIAVEMVEKYLRYLDATKDEGNAA